MAELDKKLYRLPDQSMISGVAAGMADYFTMDVTLMRLIFVIVAFVTGGTAILAYIVLAIVMPVPESTKLKSKTVAEGIKHNAEELVVEMNQSGRTNNLRNLFGLGLIVLGLWLLLQQFLPWLVFRWDFFWPAVLVLIGVILLSRSKE